MAPKKSPVDDCSQVDRAMREMVMVSQFLTWLNSDVRLLFRRIIKWIDAEKSIQYS